MDFTPSVYAVVEGAVSAQGPVQESEKPVHCEQNVN